MVWFLTADPKPTDPVAAAALDGLFREPSWIWAECSDVGWWVRPEWRSVILDDAGQLRLEEWVAEGRVTTVKSGPHRTVYRVELPHGRGAVYIKHFLIPNFRSKFRQWVRRGKGRNEARRATRLLAFGVPTIEPIALGERRKRRFLQDNYLISPEIPGMEPLDRFLETSLPALPEPRRARLRRRLAVVLGDFVARLHEGGYIHVDFHPGNLLVRLDENDEPRLAMLDLDALRVRKRLDTGDTIENLAVLNHSFWLRASRSDRRRFLSAYLERRELPGVSSAEVARGIEGETRRWAERLWRRWGKRCASDNKYFATYRGPHAWAVASRDIDPSTMAELLRDPDGPFTTGAAIPLKRSRTTTVSELPLRVEGRDAPVIYKRFNRKKWLDPLLTLFRPSRGWRAWQNGQHLASRGIPTPRNLAVIGRSARGRRILPHQFLAHETYLVTLKASPSRTLWEFTHHDLNRLDSVDRQRTIRGVIPALARLVRTMHERSLSHRDLKSANVLLEGDLDGKPPRLTLIDLVGVQLEHPLSRHHRVQNLARLYLSLSDAPGRTRTDALRFLREYLPWSLTPRAEWKSLWREIEKASRRKVDQNRRRNRKLS